jgi:hypothetical protein
MTDCVEHKQSNLMSTLELSAASFPLLTNDGFIPLIRAKLRTSDHIGLIKRLKSRVGCSNIVLALVRCTFFLPINVLHCPRSTFSVLRRGLPSGIPCPSLKMISFHESGLFPHSLTARAILHHHHPFTVRAGSGSSRGFKRVDWPFCVIWIMWR